MTFLAHQVLESVGSQIEIGYIFSVIGVIINLQFSKLGIENLDHFILVVKKKPNGAHVLNKPQNMCDFFCHVKVL